MNNTREHFSQSKKFSIAAKCDYSGTETCMDNENSQSHISNGDDIQNQQPESNVEQSIPVQKSSTGCNVKSRPKVKAFRTPASSSVKNNTNAAENITNKNTGSGNNIEAREEDGGPKPVYYSIVWCKLSKKKHKKWEGDAVLVTKGRSVSILDLEGKEIGKGTGYKTSELQSLGEGSTLVIGGKEIEIMGLLSESVFKSGKCFSTGTCKEETSQPVERKLTSGNSRPFVKPNKNGVDLANSQCDKPVEIKPRHDPAAPNSLVLPRPSKSHMWEHNKTNLPIVDMVVDPYLSQHLRPHQREGVCFIYQCVMGMKNYMGEGAILADEMGLGKTLQCICLIWTLLKQGPYGGKPAAKKVVVVTPGSLVKNWLKEFKKWLGDERLRVFAVTPDNKVEDLVNLPQYAVCIISYEMLVRTIETIQKLNFDLIICDEGHRLKNSNIKTTSFLNSLAARRRIVLTGTPVQNDLQELYSLMDFCNPGILGSQSAFRRVYEDPITLSHQPTASLETQALGKERALELNRITSMFILRRTSDINNKYLPPKMEVVFFCRPSTLQLNLYRQLVNSRVLRSCFISRDGGQHLMCISALKKLCNHPSLVHGKAAQAGGTVEQAENEGQDEQELYHDLLQHYPKDYEPKKPSTCDSGKMRIVESILEAVYDTSPREKVVLVSNYTQTLDVLEHLCNCKNYQFLRLDGQTPTSKRQALVERFNSKYAQDFVFLLSCKAGGVGLNLIGASRLILYDIDWNPANDLQAMARVWRDGQNKTVYIYRLLTTGSIEEKMYQRQISKQSLSGVVVDSRSSSTRQCFSPDELRDLFTLQENTLCATHDLLGCVDCEATAEVNTDMPGLQLSRSCQIQKPQKTKKNLSMDQLLEWKHITGPDINLSHVDPVLSEKNIDEVTFAFWNESNKQIVTVSPNVEEDENSDP